MLLVELDLKMNQGLTDWEDLSIFFDDEYFAVSAILTIGDTDTVLTGIFDTPFAQLDLGAFVVDSDDPTFLCEWNDVFNDASSGDILTIDGEVFFLKNSPESDGTGVVSLTLVRHSTQDTVGDTAPDVPEAPHRKFGGGGLFVPNRGS